MVTRSQIERLNARIEAVAAALVPPDPIESKHRTIRGTAAASSTWRSATTWRTPIT